MTSPLSRPAREPAGARGATAALGAAQAAGGSLLCVGLDPDPARFPDCVRRADPVDAIHDFCLAIADATAAHACAFKPQIAYFAAHRAERALEAVIDTIHRRHPGVPVILDAKRGDIGPTALQYAREAFERYRADALTLSPFMGLDSIEPYLQWPDRTLFLLCRTSNPGGSDLQALPVDAGGTPLYLHLAALAERQWNTHGNLGLVVGATFAGELRRVRQAAPSLPLLVPGIGAQGGDVEATVAAALTGATPAGTHVPAPRDPAAVLVNSSRAILYASGGEDFAVAAAEAARDTRRALDAARTRALAGTAPTPAE